MRPEDYVDLVDICEALELEGGSGPWLGFVRTQARKLRKIIGGKKKFRCGICGSVFTEGDKETLNGYCKPCIKKERY